MKISACMIVKNEELNITKCINSYQQYVNEIIVVDTGSTDATVQVAKGLGAKVFFFCWNNDFSQAKNFALKKTKGDWIIFLDADEYFAPADLRSIISQADQEGFEAIMCELKNIEANDEQQVLDSMQHIRIFKSNGLIKYTNSIHEGLQKADKKPLHCKVIAPEVLRIFHTGYSSKLREDKAKRNLAMLLKEAKIGKKGLEHYISDCYFAQRDFEKAIYHATLHIDSGIIVPTLEVKPYQNIVESMFNLNYDVNEIIQFINKNITRYPDHPIFHYYLAIAYFQKKEYDQSYDLLCMTLKLNRDYKGIEINKTGQVLSRIFYTMGLLSEYRCQYAEALDCYIQSLQYSKLEEDALTQLLYLVKSQNPEDVIVFLKSFYKIENPAELDFLIGVLRRLRVGAVYTYFVGLKEKVQNWDKNPSIDTLVTLAVNKKYIAAANLAFSLYEGTKSDKLELFVVVAVLLANDKELARKIKGALSIPYTSLLERYFGLTSDSPSRIMDSEESYINVLREMFYFEEPQQIQTYIELRHLFTGRINKSIADLYFQNKDYYSALYYFSEYLQSGTENDSGVLFFMGCCYYKLRSFGNAVDSFAEALERGYTDNDIFEYLRWSYQQTDDEDVRRHITKLLDC